MELLIFRPLLYYNVLAYCIAVWYANWSAADRRTRQRIIDIVLKIIGWSLFSLEDVSNSRCSNRSENIMKDSAHPQVPAIWTLTTSFSSRTKRLGVSFYCWALCKMNVATRWQVLTYFKRITFLYSVICVFFVCWWTWKLLFSFIVRCTGTRIINK